MTLQTLGTIAVAALCIGMLWNAIKYFYAAYQLRAGNAILKRTRLPDAPAPESLAEIDSAIRRLGFMPKMTMRHSVIGQPKPNTLWIYEHPAFNIELDLAESQAEPPFWVALETSFSDGALLITSYPRGYSVDNGEVKAHFAAYSLEEAFDHHLLTQIGWTEVHGEARPLDSNEADFFAHGVSVVKRHGRALYGPVIQQYVGAGVAMIGYIFLLLGLSAQVLAGDSFFSFNVVILTVLFFLIGLALAVGGNGWTKRGKMPPAVDVDKAPQIDPKVHPLNRPARTT